MQMSCMGSFRIEPIRLFSVSLRVIEQKQNSLGSKTSPPPPERAPTHVQYTQTDTIRQTDGPLVPMVGLVPIGKDVIPMVLLVNMPLIKGT